MQWSQLHVILGYLSDKWLAHVIAKSMASRCVIGDVIKLRGKLYK